jgi:hypothetical protein
MQMLRKKKISIILSSLIILLMVFSIFGFLCRQDQIIKGNTNDVKSSTTIEGFDKIKVTEIIRNINISTYGLIDISDRITILNQNSNPLNSILLGIPLNLSDDLIYLKSEGIRQNELTIERNYLIFDDFEVISIYLDSPLLPQNSISVNIIETLKNQLEYNVQNLEQIINFTGLIFPILPYKAEGNIKTAIRLPDGANTLSYDQPFGMGTSESGVIIYDLGVSFELNYLDPFLENMGVEKEITVSIEDNTRTNMQLEDIKREIDISPWGIIKVEEEHLIHNIGKIDLYSLSFKIPQNAINLVVFDELGELLGVSIGESSTNFKEVSINLLNNRAAIKPDSKLSYTIQYNIPIQNLFSVNWFEESIKLDLISTKFEFLGVQQEVKLVLEGCSNIDYISIPPDAINQDSESKILIYNSEQVSPLESKEILVTFSINLIDLMFRPIIIILLIMGILSSFVLLIKTRKKEETVIALKSELIPINEIREFCSLYEEKNALILEMRTAEEEARRKKLAKKSFKNLVSKNTNKIEQIKSEIQPFKKNLIESGEIFESIVKKLDVLDAERISVDDSINLLNNRYKRGKLPSRQAYQKLSDDFLKRRKKIDRTIDKYIQQLRNYLL